MLDQRVELEFKIQVEYRYQEQHDSIKTGKTIQQIAEKSITARNMSPPGFTWNQLSLFMKQIVTLTQHVSFFNWQIIWCLQEGKEAEADREGPSLGRERQWLGRMYRRLLYLGAAGIFLRGFS